ncbi:MAG TPA: AAA domain-containing protein [Streptosporangiaceae bacterium]
MSEERAEVLRFWRAIELFAPQAVPDVNPREHVEDVEETGLLPWEAGHPLRNLKLGENVVWRHTVYGGLFDLKKVRDLLEDAFGKDPESFDARRPGITALFAISFTDEGRPLLGTEEFASCAWAAGRLIDPGPATTKWLDGFDEAESACDAEFLAAVQPAEDDTRAAELRRQGHEVGSPVGIRTLCALIESVADRFNVQDALDPRGIRVKSVMIGRKREFSPDGSEFLNSFFVTDLAKVADADSHGAALAAYLNGPSDRANRVSVREHPDVVDHHVAPHRTPAGRWPAKPGQPLALSQQFAVNTLLSALEQRPGLFAVNGPPGTGKTTMLRELIAALVVRRAIKLAELPRPEDAFRTSYRWKSGVYERTIWGWAPSLTGFEIVVASSNNGAVNNISMEIPGRGAVDWDDASYYPELATMVLNSDNESAQKINAWGMIAARLGRKSNRTKFANAFWFGDKGAEVAGFQDILKSLEWAPRADWTATVAAFRAALHDVQDLQNERSVVHRTMTELRALRENVESLRDQQAAVESRRDKTSAGLDAARGTLAQDEHEASQAEGAVEIHRLRRPGFFAFLLGLSPAARTWRATGRELAAALIEARMRVADAAAQVRHLEAQIDREEEAARRLAGTLTELTGRLTAADGQIADAVSRWGDAVPLPGMGDEQRELSGPWTDPEWNAARTKLFLAALRLHQQFVAAEPRRMLQSLRAAMDVLNGTVPASAPADAVLAAWQSLFFVVPVISTTFASFPRVFSQLGRESLGWLFIDEAGQAAPQAAAGAIWRSSRVVVVGDPKQLEPVVTLPFTAQQALRINAGVAEWWLPGSTSAQRLADEASQYGTYLPGDDAEVWVGAPLRVHRRCEHPMFDISNTIGYGGLMVYGTSSQREPLAAPPSGWIDMPATGEARGHWIPAEGQRARELLRALRAQYHIDARQIFVISPFRDVANGIQTLLREFPGVRGGTVHTAQGKESDIVLFILGGNPARPGAKQWAAQRPNLVNVAVSRARRRIYVIGDQATWSTCRYFDTLAAQLRDASDRS